MLGDLVIQCVRLSARLSARACGLRYHMSRQRFAPPYLCACRGCDVGAECARRLPRGARRVVGRLDHMKATISAERFNAIVRIGNWKRGVDPQREPQP